MAQKMLHLGGKTCLVTRSIRWHLDDKQFHQLCFCLGGKQPPTANCFSVQRILKYSDPELKSFVQQIASTGSLSCCPLLLIDLSNPWTGDIWMTVSLGSKCGHCLASWRQAGPVNCSSKSNPQHTLLKTSSRASSSNYYRELAGKEIWELWWPSWWIIV